MDERWKPVLDELIGEVRAVTDELVSAILYGSAARGEFREARSDINVLLACRRCDAEVLRAIGPSLQRAWRSQRVRPYLVTAAEVPRIADVFPLKLLEIEDAHVVLHGPDLLASVEIDREHLRLRVEQELRNMLVRLRWDLVHSHDEPVETQRLLMQLGHRLRTVMFGVLHLHDVAPSRASFADIFAACSKIGIDAKPLTELHAAEDLNESVAKVIEILEMTVAKVDALDVP